MGGGATAKAAGWVRGRALRGAAAAALVLSLLALATRDYNSNGSRGLLASGLATRGDGDDGDIAGDYSESLLYHNRASRPHTHEHEMCSWETSQPEPSAYDQVVENQGWPTKFEHRVSEELPLKNVFCPVCGAKDQQIKFRGKNLREEGSCPQCGSINRLRQMADAALAEMRRMTGRQFASLQEATLSGLAIYNTECAGPLHAILQAAPGYVCSEFVSAIANPGEVVSGVRHEDLQQLSFDDNSFDLVLSTEVFVHIPMPYQAHHELFRILKPGGSHVFTVPFSPIDMHDDVRASVEEGRLVHHAEVPIYAHDPIHNKGALLFTIFGQEMVDRLCLLGFNTTSLHMHKGHHGILGANAWVFAATKPGPGAAASAAAAAMHAATQAATQ